MPEFVSGTRITAMAGISARQLQWWDERRVVQPANREKLDRGNGHARWYSSEQAVEIMVAANLRRRGVSLQTVRRILRQFRRACVFGTMCGNPYPETQWYLLTDYGPDATMGRLFRVESDLFQIMEILKSAAYPVLVVALPKLKEKNAHDS